MRETALLLHIGAVAIWVGGMFFAHYCLRPAAAVLEPPQRLTLMSITLRRFFSVLHVTIAVIWLTGLRMMEHVGFAAAPRAWHLMLGLGALMTLVFAIAAWYLNPRLRKAVAEQRWADGGAVLARIRQLVAFNLVLGLLTIVVATIGPLAG
ncbi:MAG: CopD family protein [Burkholderiaceae bacterium]